MKNKNILITLLLFVGLAALFPILSNCANSSKDSDIKHNFMKLPYSYDALEPYIDAQTMELHFDKHHRGYFTKFTNEIKGTDLEKTSMEDIFANIEKYSTGIRNNGGGYYNHNIFWENMSPDGGKPSDELLAAINKKFGSLDKFKEEFSNQAATQFGSGWAWLVYTKSGDLEVCNTPNQDNPLMSTAKVKGIPLLTLDVWEHAYYLKYRNLRPDYIAAFWNVVNWNEVNKRFEEAKK